MSITRKESVTVVGRTVDSYFLDNGRGLQAEILTLGGILRRLVFNGTDVVLGRKDIEAYVGDPTYFGTLVGRNCNRIENCCFELGGREYKLAANDSGRNNNLHGGPGGFSAKIWQAEAVDGDEPQLILSVFSEDGEEGFPGNVSVTVSYTLTRENSIKIHYSASSDADTLVNMTNHSYFNLNGHSSGDVKEHTLWLNCGFFTPLNSASVPDGRVLCTSGTPFDFTVPKKIGKDLECGDGQMVPVLGYDHNFAIDGRGYRKFAEAEGDITHIVMEAFTDRPAVQLYTGNYVGDGIPCKDGAKYGQYQGFCLETQAFPNAMKYSFFPSPILRKGEKYDTVTEYKFSVR